MPRGCIFCDIVGKKSPADILYHDEEMVVFKDIHPHAPVHLLIVPRKHIRSINDVEDEDTDLISHMVFVGRLMAKKEGIARSGYKLLFNVERGGGQVIFHLHLHLMGGWR